MARTITTTHDLRDLIRDRATQIAPCEGVYIAGVYSHEPDASGCNWSLSSVRGSDDVEASSACLQALNDLVLELQAQYNVVESAD